jgi:hypothetical protein
MSISDIQLLLSNVHHKTLYSANKKVKTPLGIFQSGHHAGVAYGLSGARIRQRIIDRVPGYEYVCPESQQKVIEKNPFPIVRPQRGCHIRSPETLKKMSKPRKDFSPQALENIRAGHIARRGISNTSATKAVQTPLGKFDSITKAAAAHNVKWGGTIRQRIKKGVPGYEYI